MTQNFPIIYNCWLATKSYESYRMACHNRAMIPVSESVYDLFIQALDLHHTETA